jgi:hypothetical protein
MSDQLFLIFLVPASIAFPSQMTGISVPEQNTFNKCASEKFVLHLTRFTCGVFELVLAAFLSKMVVNKPLLSLNIGKHVLRFG